MLQMTPPPMLPCPACAQETVQRELFRKNGCTILQCAACGLGRAEAAGGFDPSTYYTGGYFSGGHADGYGDYRGAEPVLRREFARTVKFLRRFCAGGRLLELGCAFGFFLDEAKSHFEVHGIELAKEAAAFCRSRGLDVVSGCADEVTLASLGHFDAIVLLDVIEHLPAPEETLALCARALNPDGVIMLTTGDFGSLAARLTGARWRLMTPPQHLWFFNAESMCRLAERNRLAMEHLDHPWKVVPLSLIFFQLRRMLGLRGGAQPMASRIGLPVNLFDAMRVVLRKA